MDREKVIDKIVDDLPKWLKRDSSGFWDHVSQLERDYLKGLSDKDLEELEIESN
jgi:hypothetical protein